MDAFQTYREIMRLGLTCKVTENFDVSFKPKKRITPELSAAIKQHKGRIVCQLAYDRMLFAASEAYGLEVDVKKMPPPSPRMREALRDEDPQALLESMEEYTVVWRVWPVLQRAFKSPRGGMVEVEGYGLLIVAPDAQSKNVEEIR